MGVYGNNCILYDFDCIERKIVIWNVIWIVIFFFRCFLFGSLFYLDIIINMLYINLYLLLVFRFIN